MDPDDVIAALRSGSRWAEPALVTIVGPVLLGYARAVATDLTEADHEAAVEAAILTGVRKIDKFDRRRGTFAGWLRPFVVHALADIRRNGRGQPATLPDDLPEAAVPDDPGAADEVELAALNAALGSLSETDRLIVSMRDIEGLTYQVCAERIGGVSDAACRVRHFRAIRRLATACRVQPALAHYFEEAS